MRIIRVTVGILATNAYAVVCESERKAVIIDPGDGPDEIIARVEEAGADVSHIMLTHGHVDHIGGLTVLARRTGAPVHIHPEDRVLLTSVGEEFRSLLPSDYEPPALTEPLDDGQELWIGDTSVKVLHTPGHTRGSCSFLVDGHLFTGDLLFAGSVGRTDLPGGDSRTLMHSLGERVMGLPDETVIHPGHGADTTLAQEKATNPFLALERLRWQG